MTHNVRRPNRVKVQAVQHMELDSEGDETDP